MKNIAVFKGIGKCSDFEAKIIVNDQNTVCYIKKLRQIGRVIYWSFSLLKISLSKCSFLWTWFQLRKFLKIIRLKYSCWKLVLFVLLLVVSMIIHVVRTSLHSYKLFSDLWFFFSKGNFSPMKKLFFKVIYYNVFSFIKTPLKWSVSLYK